MSAEHVNCRFLDNSGKLLPPSTSELSVRVLPVAACKCAEHTSGRICVDVFHCKGSFVGFMKSSCHPGVPLTGWRLSVGVSSCTPSLLCGQPGSCTRALYVYPNSIAIICLLSPGCLGICCQRLREACGCRDLSCGAPGRSLGLTLSLISAFGSVP